MLLKKSLLKLINNNGFLKSLVTLIKSIIKNDFYGMAAEMGFMMVIGIFPFMLFLMTVFGWLGNNSSINSILMILSNIMPEQAMNLILMVLSEVMIFKHPGLMAILGFCGTIILSTNGVAVILKGLNRAYKVEETRSFVYTRLLAFVMMIVNTLVLFLSMNLIIFGKLFLNFAVKHSLITPNISAILSMLRWPTAFFVLYFMAFLCYYILPDLKGNESFKRKSALPGTLFFCCFWLIGSWGFSLYVNNLGTYNLVYGTIGAFAVLMVWLYYTSILMLIGGEINSQVYNKLSRKAKEIEQDLASLRLQKK